MAREDRHCVVCGTHYRFCPYCAEFSNRDRFPLWMMTWDDKNCKDISDVIARFDCKDYDVEEAADRLTLLDLSKVKNQNILDKIKEIQAAKAEINKAETPVVEEKEQEDTVTEEATAQAVEKTTDGSEQPQKSQNKKMYYKNKKH